jgi:hypothetical protein
LPSPDEKDEIKQTQLQEFARLNKKTDNHFVVFEKYGGKSNNKL